MGIRFETRLARDVEGVLIGRARKRMERVGTASFEVTLFRRRDDEGEQPVAGYEWAHWMHAWATIGADRCEERETDAVLVQQGLPLRRHLRLLLLEDKPRHHGHRLPISASAREKRHDLARECGRGGGKPLRLARSGSV